jgi:hypothetical protein
MASFRRVSGRPFVFSIAHAQLRLTSVGKFTQQVTTHVHTSGTAWRRGSLHLKLSWHLPFMFVIRETREIPFNGNWYVILCVGSVENGTTFKHNLTAETAKASFSYGTVIECTRNLCQPLHSCMALPQDSLGFLKRPPKKPMEFSLNNVIHHRTGHPKTPY